MKNFSIDKLTEEAFEVTLHNHKLDLGNNYTLTHFEAALCEALGEDRDELVDILYSLDCPSYSEIVFTYKGKFNYHSDSLDIVWACAILKAEI